MDWWNAGTGDQVLELIYLTKSQWLTNRKLQRKENMGRFHLLGYPILHVSRNDLASKHQM